MSFKADLKPVLDEAAVNKSPVKMKGFKRKANYRNNNIQDIELNRSTSLSIVESAPFPYVVYEPKKADFITVRDIQQSGYDRQAASLAGYVEINECYSTQIQRFTTKKDAWFNDKTGIIQIALWSNTIDSIKVSGTYNLFNVVVRDLNDGRIISTTPSTTTEVLTPPIKKMPPPFELYHIKNFPITSFSIQSRQPKCSKCGNLVSQTPAMSDFFKCECGTSTKYSSLPVSYIVKLLIRGRRNYSV